MTPEPYRPRLHFSPSTGWVNDPNGLIFIDGAWHVFYQHHPHSTTWGPMHWGHASSRDLVTWTEHSVALHPDAHGACFSGSAIETPLGEVKLFYTAHGPGPDGADHQVQCLVHADRTLTTFRSDLGNPIVPNPGVAAFRDPKVFWHAPSRRWIMVLTHGQSIGIRSSSNLIDWTLESEFGATEGRHGLGPWECPDLFPLVAPDGATLWVMLVGVGSDAFGGGSGTQYFVGHFDGRRFVNVNPPETVLWADYGRDYYAAQSFFGASRPTTIAWASNWQYANQTPTRAFRGVMSLPRELSLVETPDGIRLRQVVPASVAASFENARPGELPETGAYRVECCLDGSRPVGLALFGEASPQFVFTRSLKGAVSVRSIRSERTGVPNFAHDYRLELPEETPLKVEVFVDNGLVEISVGGGLAWLTNLYFPSDPAGTLRVVDVPKAGRLAPLEY